MKALVVSAPHQLEWREVPAPQIGLYQALVRMEVCGICNSTDHKLIAGTMFWAPPFPFVLGHESVGVVVEIGAKVTKFKVGDRVTRPIYQACDQMNAAIGGLAQYGLVNDAQAMARDGDASLLSDYNALRQLVVPAGMSARDAALCISLAETASVTRHLPNPRGRKIAVAGTGAAGLSLALWLKLAGACVIVLGRREERLQQARDIGADAALNTRDADFLTQLREVAGGPLDGLIEATGDADLAAQLGDSLKNDGFACAYSVPPTGVCYDSRWTNAQVEEHLSFAWVADLLRRGWIKTEWFVSHDFTPSEAVAAYQQAEQGQVFKGFVHFGSE